MRSGRPSASRPGMRDSPRTLMAKMRMSTTRGARILRSTRKTPAEDRWGPSSGRGGRGTATVVLAALEGGGLDHEQRDRDHVGEQGSTREGHHGGGLLSVQGAVAPVGEVGPHHGRSEELEAGDQAGSEVHG